MIINENGSWVLDSQDSPHHAHDEYISEVIQDIVRNENIKSVYDFGCGYGDYLLAIEKNFGIQTTGFEQNPFIKEYKNIKAADLSQPLLLKEKADLVMSLEVGEHIPKEFEHNFIDTVCNNSSNVLVLSWAIVGQIGDGHINCQNNDYIISEVEKRGFVQLPEYNDVRQNAKLEWFRNTFMVFKRSV